MSNLERAVGKLSQFLQIAKGSEIERAGVIQAFEFCFELFWKVFCKILENEGLNAGSPKSALKGAFQRGFFTDETLWLSMLDDRSLAVHTYNEELAAAIFARIKASYLLEFQTCLETLKRFE